jgi:hypothetical protein
MNLLVRLLMGKPTIRLSVLDVRSFRAADCDTDYYLVVAKVRERLAVNKDHRNFIWGGLVSRS